jgi:hypothetical protein
MQYTLNETQLIATMLFLPGSYAAMYAVKNFRRLKDVWYLITKRSRCVKVNFTTRTNTNIERYTVPDEYGMMHLDGGIYYYDQRYAKFNSKRRMYEITLLDNQFLPEKGALAEAESPIAVDVTYIDDAGIKKTEKRRVKQYVLSFAGIIPQKVTLPAVKDEKGIIIEPEENFGAKELRDFAESHVSRDIVTATAQELTYMKYAMYASVFALAAVVVASFIIYQKIDHVQAMLDAARLVQGK